MFKTLLSTSNVSALSVLLFYMGEFQVFAHTASVTDCDKDLKFETLNLAGTEWEGLCVEERVNVGGSFTVILLFVTFSFCNF